MKVSLPPNERRFNGLLWRSLLLPIVLLLATAAFLTWATGQAFENAEKVRVSDELLSRATRALKLGVDMETGIRGYQVVGDRSLLQPYHEARAAISAEFSALARLTQTPAQGTLIEAARRAHAEWARLGEELIARREQGREFQSADINLRGKQLFDSFRGHFTNFIAAQEAEKREQVEQFAVTSKRVLHFRIATALGIGAAIGWFARRQLRNVAAMFEASEETARREAEKARQSSAEFQAMFEHALVGVGQVDLTTGKFLRVNPAYLRMLGYSAEELVGQRSPREFLHPDDRERAGAELQRFLAGETDRYIAENRYVRKDGEVIWVSNASAIIRDAEGRPVRTVGVVLDITDRKRAEDALRAARDDLEQRVAERTQELQIALEKAQEVDRLKSEFLATMSHELRTPLNSIIGFTEIVVAGIPGPLNEEQKRQLQFVHGSANHLLHLINDLLDLARIESGRVEPAWETVVPAEVIREALDTIRPLSERKGLRLESELELPATLRTDRKMFFQVLLNLLGNAVKFTDRGEVRLTARQTQGALEVAVRDTGIGIKADQMALLFEAFRQVDGSVQRRYEGTGLGLYLCKRIAGLLGGAIRAASDYGRGSTFTFTLPLPHS